MEKLEDINREQLEEVERKISVFISEDDPDDKFIFETSVRSVLKEADINHVFTGHELLKGIANTILQGGERQGNIPDIILADLNAPFFVPEIIAEIRNYPQLKDLPIYIFSNDLSENVKEKLILAGATGVYSKPCSFHSLSDILEEIFRKQGLLTSEIKKLRSKV